MEHAPVRRGILGPGTIARPFTESPLLPLDDTLAVMRVLDAARAASGG